MTKARFKTGLVLLILLASLVQWPTGQAITPQDQTISITDTHDDLFITETGIGIDSQLCHILDPNMDIRSFLVFRELEINYWEPLHNATLRFRTTAILDFDADSSVTVYGMRYSDLQLEGILNPSWVLTVPLTSAYVNVNTSQFYGQTWHEVNVTAIVEELIRSIRWDGDGADGTETGDAIGFIILGAEGYDTRWFIDYLYGAPTLAPQLVIHWNHEPPPPSGAPANSAYVEEYGNYTIWRDETELAYPRDPMEYVYTYNGTPATYNVTYDFIGNENDPVNVSWPDPSTGDATGMSTQRKMVRMSNGTLYDVYSDRSWDIIIIKSNDDGATWIEPTVISTGTYLQEQPSIAVDSEDNLHVVWIGDPDVPSKAQIWYLKWNGTGWETPERKLSTRSYMYSYDQRPPAIAIDSDDAVHVVWPGRGQSYEANDQIWYVTDTPSWISPVRISTAAGQNVRVMSDATIAVDSNDTVHVSFVGEGGGFSFDQVWYTNNSNVLGDGWFGGASMVRLSTVDGMSAKDQEFPSIAMDSNDTISVVWNGKSTALATDHQIWYSSSPFPHGTANWTSPMWISNYTDMEDYDQMNPCIALNSTDAIHVVWDGKASGYTDYEKVWHSEYVSSWSTPDVLKPINQNRYPNLRWAKWPYGGNVTYFVSDANGTIVQEDLDSIEDAEDWIDTEDPDPEDPDPAGLWSEGPGGETGAFTRFRMRLWFIIIGFGCVFGPVLFFAWRRPSGYYLFCGAIVMLIGLGLLLSIGQV